MGSAYGISNCLAWYRAGVGVYSDAGATAANPGDGVYQWNDLSGSGNHATQTTAGNRPVYNNYAAKLSSAGAVQTAPYSNNINTYTPAGSPASGAASLLFDGANTYLNLPSGVALTAAGCTVLMVTRGSYFAPVSFGTDGTLTINYGWQGGSPQHLGLYNGGLRPFPAVTYLPELIPAVHGFRCSATLGESRHYLGSNETSALSFNYCNFSMTGGAIGRTLNVSAAGYGNFPFLGEIYEILIFSTPLTNSDVQSLLQLLQNSNRLRPDSNTRQVVFVGDSLTAGGPNIPSLAHCYPWILTQQYGGAFKPLLIATPGHTIAQQQSLVTSEVVTLDLSAFSINIAIVCCGSNDIVAGRTTAQVTADLATLCTGLRAAGFKVILATITPRSASTGFTTDNVTTLAAVNSAILANYSAYADVLVDWANDPSLIDCTNTTFYADTVHTTDAGDGIKAALIQRALDPLLSPAATPLNFATFYAPGRNFSGKFGNFVRN